jgi:hypothetical protein
MEDTTNTQAIKDILEIVTHIRDNAVSKEEFDRKIGSIQSTMVTKDYLDEKLGDLRGDFTVLMRKEDTKLKALVGILYSRQIIDAKDMETLQAMEPFPSLSLPA